MPVMAQRQNKIPLKLSATAEAENASVENMGILPATIRQNLSQIIAAHWGNFERVATRCLPSGSTLSEFKVHPTLMMGLLKHETQFPNGQRKKNN